MDFRTLVGDGPASFCRRPIEFDYLLEHLPVLAMEYLVIYHRQYSEERYSFLARTLYSKLRSVNQTTMPYLRDALDDKNLSLMDEVLRAYVRPIVSQPRLELSKLVRIAMGLHIDLCVVLKSTLIRVHMPLGVSIGLTASTGLELFYPRDNVKPSEVLPASSQLQPVRKIRSCGHPEGGSCSCPRFSVEAFRLCDRCYKKSRLTIDTVNLCVDCAITVCVFRETEWQFASPLPDLQSKVSFLLSLPFDTSVEQWPCLRCHRETQPKISFLCEPCFKLSSHLPKTRQCVKCWQMKTSFITRRKKVYCGDCASSLLFENGEPFKEAKRKVVKKLRKIDHTLKCSICSSKGMACYCKCLECTQPTKISRCNTCTGKYSNSVKQMMHSNLVCQRCRCIKKFIKTVNSSQICLDCATELLQSEPFPLEYDPWHNCMRPAGEVLVSREERAALVQAFPLSYLGISHCTGCGGSLGQSGCYCLCIRCSKAILRHTLSCPNCKQSIRN